MNQAEYHKVIELVVEQIESEMKRRLVTQAELAKMARISPQRVSTILARKSRSLPSIRAMRNALGLGPKEQHATRRP